MPESEGDERKEDYLSREGDDESLGLGDDLIEIPELESQAQVEHQDREDWEYYPDGVHEDKCTFFIIFVKIDNTETR